MEKGVWRFEIALGFFYFFLGGNPWKRETGDLRLLCDYFFIFFFGWQPLEKGIRRFEIALGLFFFIFLGGKPLEKFMINIFF